MELKKIEEINKKIVEVFRKAQADATKVMDNLTLAFAKALCERFGCDWEKHEVPDEECEAGQYSAFQDTKEILICSRCGEKIDNPSNGRFRMHKKNKKVKVR